MAALLPATKLGVSFVPLGSPLNRRLVGKCFLGRQSLSGDYPTLDLQPALLGAYLSYIVSFLGVPVMENNYCQFLENPWLTGLGTLFPWALLLIFEQMFRPYLSQNAPSSHKESSIAQIPPNFI
ncbi:hypothetical protein EON65_58125 [archaeon]|nr:MAG: hypothetical protein EON65_58125 [archaeon]